MCFTRCHERHPPSGLHLAAFDPRSIVANPRVIEFYRQHGASRLTPSYEREKFAKDTVVWSLSRFKFTNFSERSSAPLSKTEPTTPEETSSDDDDLLTETASLTARSSKPSGRRLRQDDDGEENQNPQRRPRPTQRQKTDSTGNADGANASTAARAAAAAARAAAAAASREKARLLAEQHAAAQAAAQAAAAAAEQLRLDVLAARDEHLRLRFALEQGTCCMLGPEFDDLIKTEIRKFLSPPDYLMGELLRDVSTYGRMIMSSVIQSYSATLIAETLPVGTRICDTSFLDFFCARPNILPLLRRALNSCSFIFMPVYVPGHFIMIFIHLSRSWQFAQGATFDPAPPVKKCWIVGMDSIQRTN